MTSEFARQLAAIVMISSELPEILGMSDRVVVMSEGRVTGELTGNEDCTGKHHALSPRRH